MTLINIHDKEEVEKALEERRASAPKKVNNASLPAGSPMFYYCKSCGHQTAVKPESWVHDPPPKFCDFCKQLKDAGWLDT